MIQCKKKNTRFTSLEEIKKKERFKFGENWKSFISKVNKEQIKNAETSLKEMLEIEELNGKRFLDLGSGSGLFSLAACNLGANVTSFDYDETSVWCTSELKRRFYSNDLNWNILQGSILDKNFISNLGTFDYVYSWGVLHNTGRMWESMDNIASSVKDGG